MKFIFVVFSVFIFSVSSFPCTSFRITSDQGPFMAKGYDWDISHGYLIINKRGLEKISFLMKPGQIQTSWVSKYGSATFNQYGQEFPNGGINEAGLAIEILVQNDSRYPRPSDRPSLVEAQWIQYQLDQRGSVQELVVHARDVDVFKGLIGAHYFACDQTGECASFDFVDGRMEIHQMPSGRHAALANTSYAKSWKFAKLHSPFGGERSMPSGGSSLARFTRALAATNKTYREGFGPAFDVLKSVRISSSVWNTVYDLEKREIQFRSLVHDRRVSLSLDDFDFSCSVSNSMAVDLASEGSFESFGHEDNLKLIRRSVKNHFPEEMILRAARYPGIFNCL